MTTATEKLMTHEEFLELPEDDSVERELINGILKEWPAVILRSPRHSIVMAEITRILGNWAQSNQQFRILTGDAGFHLRDDPDTNVGIDIAVANAEAVQSAVAYVNGPPVLAVEILSPSDSLERVEDKIDTYLECGVPLVWIVNPNRRTVTVHRPGEEPALFNVKQQLSGEPQLPGFLVAVAEIFS